MAPMQRIPYRRVLPWLGLACIIFAYVVAVVRLHPTNFFGRTNDDMIYFSSAKALANGRGYILPSLPGSPPATKYPILLPLLLSFVWRWDPSFPGNLAVGIAVIVAFGCVFTSVMFVFLRRLPGIGTVEALMLTAFCALHPTVLFYSSTMLSDIPFAALAFLAMVAANRAMRIDEPLSGSAISGVLAGLCVLMRLSGIPIAAGLLVFGITKRVWRQAAAFAVTVTPFVVALAWRSFLAAPAAPPIVSDAGPGWNQTWLYYTNYAAFREMASPNLHMVWTFALNQFLYLGSQIPGYFLSPLFDKSLLWWLIATPLVLWIVMAGILGQVRVSGWQPMHFALSFYIIMIICWDYPDSTRFLICFLPLFVGSFWLQGKKIVKRLILESRSTEVSNKALSLAGAMGMAALTMCIAWNFAIGGPRELTGVSRNCAALLREKLAGYEWLRQNSQPQERVIAWEDASLYLYTGRQSMSQMAFLPSGAYDPVQFKSDLYHMTDVAKAIRADYWFASADDSEKQWRASKQLLAARLAQIESALPEVFRSSDGRVRIYRADCIWNSADPLCKMHEHALVASEGEKTSVTLRRGPRSTETK
jgi:hypothetical protein